MSEHVFSLVFEISASGGLTRAVLGGFAFRAGKVPDSGNIRVFRSVDEFTAFLDDANIKPALTRDICGR
jgi:hypothetical protein